jgi:uncharacterized protein
MNVLLSGIVGSTAYGLAHKDSDVDRLSLYAAPTKEFHGLHRPQESVVTKNPDVTAHEVAKWCRLALSGNPTVAELVWLPDELYELRTPHGDELIGIRTAFLSAKRVRDSYFGYATQQFSRLESRNDGTFGPDLAKRTAKHARHMYRLLIQGLELWTTGSLTIRLENPDVVHSFGARIALGDIHYARQVLSDYEEAFNRTRTVLPDVPDEAAVEDWLRRVRHTYYTPPSWKDRL